MITEREYRISSWFIYYYFHFEFQKWYTVRFRIYQKHSAIAHISPHQPGLVNREMFLPVFFICFIRSRLCGYLSFFSPALHSQWYYLHSALLLKQHWLRALFFIYDNHLLSSQNNTYRLCLNYNCKLLGELSCAVCVCRGLKVYYINITDRTIAYGDIRDGESV